MMDAEWLPALQHSSTLLPLDSAARKTDEGVPSAVGVDDLVAVQLDDRVERDLAIDRHDSGIASLRDHNVALPGFTALLVHRDQREARGDELHVVCLPAARLRVRAGLGLVAEEVINVWKRLLQARAEGRHLHDEGRREVEAVNRAGAARMRGH